MSHELIYLISHLFNIRQSYLCNYQVNANDIEDDDGGQDFTERKIMKIKLLYQILYYSLHDGKEKNTTPFIYCPQCVRKVQKQRTFNTIE